MGQPIDIDAVIAKLDAAMEKYRNPDDPDAIRGVLAGPAVPVRLPENLPDIEHLALEPHEDPEVDAIFRWSVRGYIAISGESKPSAVVLDILRHLAEV